MVFTSNMLLHLIVKLAEAGHSSVHPMSFVFFPEKRNLRNKKVYPYTVASKKVRPFNFTLFFQNNLVKIELYFSRKNQLILVLI